MYSVMLTGFRFIDSGRKLLLWSCFLSWGIGAAAQTISDELRNDVRRSAGMHYALIESETHDTPPPPGKRPFYINHYGCPSPYYPDQPERYDRPYQTLVSADSLGKLTEAGKKVLHRVSQLRREAHESFGELTEAGKQQARDLVRLMTRRVPEAFTDSTYVDGRSILQRHCLLTLGETIIEVSRAHQPMEIRSTASERNKPWMNPDDEALNAQRSDSLAMACFNEFSTRWALDDSRLMGVLFNDADYVKTIDATELSRQLFDLAGCTQYTETAADMSLYNLFTPDEIHRHWMRRNAWAYIRYGGSTLSGGYQPYSQRRSLWNLFHMSDSVLKLDHPVVHLRYTHENVVMSLVCLLELDGFGLKTACLDSLENYGWADYRIAPLGGSIMMVLYRTDKDDPDPLVRVMLNGREARLPVPTDYAPYYHWQDVKRYYLRKLYVYARERNEE